MFVSFSYFKFSRQINADKAFMMNRECRNEDIPFGKECSKKWRVYDNANRIWVADNSVSLECTHDGIDA